MFYQTVDSLEIIHHAQMNSLQNEFSIWGIFAFLFGLDLQMKLSHSSVRAKPLNAAFSFSTSDDEQILKC